MASLGNAAGIRAVASVLSDVAGTLGSAAGQVSVSGQVQGWRGEAAQAAGGQVTALAATLQTTQVQVSTVAQALISYAEVVEKGTGVVAAARRSQVAAFARLATGMDLTAVTDLASAQTDSAAATSAVQSAATSTATTVRQNVPPKEIDLDEDAVEEGSWHPSSVVQGNIGDCYLIATLMGYLRTDAGDELLRDNVCWDEERGGYRVTLYVDGKAQEFFVESTYDIGATQGGKMGIRG